MLSIRKPHSTFSRLALLLGAALAFFSGTQLLFGLWSYTWRSANGVITYSKAFQTFRTTSVGLRYNYSYQDREYSGTTYRFSFVLDRLNSWQVDSVQARYPVGEKVQVAVNTWNPAEAVLEPGVNVSSFMWPALGLAIMLGAFLPDRTKRRREGLSKASTEPRVSVGLAGNPALKPTSRYRTAKALLLIGSIVLVYGANTLLIGWRSQHWPTTDGKLLYSANRNAGRNYGAQLWYEYYVQGTRHVAGDYRVGGNSSPFRAVAKGALMRYPVGRTVKVYYDPANPAEAVLEPGLWYGNFIFPGLGLVIIGCAFLSKTICDAGAAKAQRG